MKFVFAVLVLNVFFDSNGQSVSAISAKVMDAKTKMPLENVTVQLLPEEIVTVTDANGLFQFNKVANASHTVVLSIIGYTTETILVKDNSMGSIELEERTIALENVTITATPGMIGSSSTIDKSAIIHTQPTSLADVLQLIPGQLASNPNLGAAQQINLRQVPTTGDAAKANALGTQIILDGVPFSNNANLQTDVTILNSSPGALPPFSSVAGRGNDLRQIPADNIESIEVVRGVPSARFGDLTSGIVIVNSRIGSFKPEIRVRMNPNLEQASFFTGFHSAGKSNTYNISADALNASDDIRDGFNKYTRVQAQISWQKFWDKEKRFITTTIGSFYVSNDGQNQNPADTRNQIKRYATDDGLKFSTAGKWRANKKWLASLNYIASVTQSNQKAYYQSLVTRDLFPISTALRDTTQKGVYGKSEYLNKTTVDGMPLNAYTRLEATTSAKEILNTQHKLTVGTEWRYDVNNGNGRQFDLLTPPRQNYSMGDRPISFSNIPGMHQISYYLEDRMTSELYRKRWILQAGVRVDNVSPTGILTSKYGLVVAPRINTALEIANGISLRVGYGIAAKAPPLNYLYPGIRYFDLVNFNYFATNPAERLVIITTRTINLNDQPLKPYQSKKYEAGFDIEKKRGSLNVSFFSETTTGAIGINREVKPFEFARLIASSTPPNQQPIVDPNPASIETFFAAYDVPVNNRFIENQGVEYNVDLREIPAIRTSFNITGAYIRTTSFDDGEFIDAQKAYLSNTTPIRFGIYQSSSKVIAERLNTSVRFIHRIPQLNMVVSALWQTVWITKSTTEALNPFPLGYMNRAGEKIYLNEEEARQIAYGDLVRTVSDARPFSLPALYLFNIRLTKEWAKGFGFSFFANNFINDRPLHTDVNTGGLVRRNEPLFFGAEFNFSIR